MRFNINFIYTDYFQFWDVNLKTLELITIVLYTYLTRFSQLLISHGFLEI